MAVEARGQAVSNADGEAVCCPLCDYDLRGLPEPRGPECGCELDWADLFDPNRQRHPYLFERHPRRNLWSFAQTLVAGWRPNAFWSGLRPTHAVRTGRLMLYALLA